MAEAEAYHNYELVETGDGSYTLFSSQYNQCYHSTKDGAFVESLYKHVIPAFLHQKHQSTLTILDICFGLGFNTLTTLWYNDQHDKKPLRIYSPELDASLLKHLDTVIYPKEFDPYRNILKELLRCGKYKDGHHDIELFIGDARVYVKGFNDCFDIVYQDPFSPDENPLLWTLEYFKDIQSSMKKTGVLTTYSISLKTRLALYDNGFSIYLFKDEKTRSSTIALLQEDKDSLGKKATWVNVEHKRAINPTVKPLKDDEF